jgi:hypothetical protein
MLIGIDFDNTIARYDDLFARLALEAGYLDAVPVGGKVAVRDAVRLQHDDMAWQRMQAEAYGSRMAEAEMMPGFLGFVGSARRLGVPLVVVSHKSVFSNAVPGPNLRYAALGWMRANEFFDPGGLGFSVDDIYFEGRQSEKVARINELGCTHFIDDLPEIFAEKSFPDEVLRILLSTGGEGADTADAVISDWFDIRDFMFNDLGRAVA